MVLTFGFPGSFMRSQHWEQTILQKKQKQEDFGGIPFHLILFWVTSDFPSLYATSGGSAPKTQTHRQEDSPLELP